jgi:DNA-binding IclR family transcriptional regulator
MLTLKLFEIGNKKIENIDMVSIANPFLNELMKKTNEVIHLVVMEGSEIVYVDKVEPQSTIRMHSRIGRRSPMYCTAVGKSMMSYMTEEQIEEIWKDSLIKKLTEYTITDLGSLKEQLKLVRDRGYAIDEQENEIGIRCVGSTLFDHLGKICGAVSVSGSTISFTEDKIEVFGELLIEHANKISKELGYRF